MTERREPGGLPTGEQQNAGLCAEMLEQALVNVLADYPVNHVGDPNTVDGEEYKNTLTGLRQIAWVAQRCREDSGLGTVL